jgi:hypothetical protein
MSDKQTNPNPNPKVIRIQATDFQANPDDQETYGPETRLQEMGSRLTEVSFEEFNKNLKECVAPVLESVTQFTKNDDNKLKLKKMTISLGASLEGKLFIASGKLEAGIQLEFSL